MLKAQVQTALRVLFPPACAGCGAQVDSEFALCGECWRDLPLISGAICDTCGVPILAAPGTDVDICEDCHAMARPWDTGRAALLYKDLGRRLVLQLKHSDRQEIAVMASLWLAQAAAPLLRDETILAPIPLHWSRMLKRRYNQAALLAQHLALRVERRAVLDLLERSRRTLPLDGATVETRFARLEGALTVKARRAALLQGAHVLLIDDVMTSGATFAAAAETCLAAGAARVDVLALARVGKDT